jgi:hypothetical protein
MIRRESFINKLHELNYSYKSQQKRTYLYRKNGGTHCISVPMRDLLTEEYVRSTLTQAGCEKDEIEQFISQYSGTSKPN